ncbi:hypothetical protein FHS18_004628 [Paenibacillus phyllosphaerae]|uniref:Uncharacterized protein n=1 Tax=Paenibacillus phyllosphaerae TaxID=274593 RepID=A0A7W5FPT0_9BACL|nr:hypothetical protein [Paenibacillus phyllosphaerae]MBB3112527.1 hypothetical protein [Paenibacillus phyllosphaerae]
MRLLLGIMSAVGLDGVKNDITQGAAMWKSARPWAIFGMLPATGMSLRGQAYESVMHAMESRAVLCAV